jgi:tetratricopeptide (TPR) repeat protein
VHERSAESLRSLGRYAEAAAELRRTIEIAQRVVRPDHPEFPISLGRLAEVTRLAGDPDEAVALYQRALELQPPQPERPRKSRSALLLGLAESLHAAGRAVEADEAYAGAIEHARGTAGARTTVYLDAATGRATLLVERGRADEAMVLLGPIHAGLGSASTQEERRAAAGLVFGLAQVARATGDRERARTLAEDARVRFVAVPDEAKAAEVESWLAAR